MSWASRAAAALALAVAAACVAPPEGPGVDTAVLDAPVVVDPRIYTVRIRSQTCEGLGVGSGFLIDATTIVTNRHVVEGADTLEVETSEGQSLTVGVASQGLLADLAIVRLDAPVDGGTSGMGPATAVLADANPEPGTGIRAVGYPEGGPLTVTEGVVQDYEVDTRLGNLSKVIRSDVEIHPGNSGGPAVDDQDRVVGVVYAIEVATERSLIVPVETLRRLLDNDEGLERVEGC
jgi:S1-C subfamily serine protease